MKTETYRAALWKRRISGKETFSSVCKYTYNYIKKITLSLQTNLFSFFPKKRKPKRPCRALPCVFQKGSLTAEAAMVLPLFLLAMLSVAGYMLAYARQINMTEELLESAERMAVYRGVLHEETGQAVPLVKTYRFVLAVRLPSAGKLQLTAVAQIRPWVGYRGQFTREGSMEGTELVYISDNEEAYHTSPDCSYLDIHLLAMDRTEAARAKNEEGKRYTACDKCCRGSTGGTVYVSGKGSHYHASTGCSGLARSPKAVTKDSVSHLSLCVRCRKRGNTG